MILDIDDPDLTLAEIFRAWPATMRVFRACRTACPGCPIAPFHTIADTCFEYRLDEPAFRAALRAVVAPPLEASAPPGPAGENRPG